MKIATAHLESASPYSQGRYYNVAKKSKESHADYEKRTWRERLHTDDDDNVVIPQMAFKNCVSEIAKYLSIQIPGKGKSTYTKHFEAGILVLEPLVLPIKKKDVRGQWNFVPSSGRRGDGSRVEKCFPVIDKWEGNVEFHIFDDTVTEDVFEDHLYQAGQFIGIGVFRPRNNGYWGRFKVHGVEWSTN